MDGGNPVAIDLDGDGALEEADGQDEAVLTVAADEESGESGEGADIDADLVTCLEIGPGLSGGAGVDGELDGVDFGVANRRGDACGSDEGEDSGRLEDLESLRAVIEIETAEEVAREERGIDLLNTIGVAAGSRKRREENGVTFAFQDKLRSRLSAGAHLECEPGVRCV